MRSRLFLLAVVVSAMTASVAVTASPAAADPTPSWTTATFPVPTAPNGDLEAVDCSPGTTYCVEVGSYFDTTGRQRPLLAHERSVADWVQDAAPTLPASAVSVSLKAVSCAGPTMCAAVGSTSDGDFHDRPLVLTWNGTAWSRAASPLPDGRSGGRLAGVSCATPTACVAVGDLDAGGNGRASLSYSYDGAHWTARPVPVVNSKPYPFEGLYAVSCPAARSCTAVGYGRNPGGLIQVWNGSTWHSQKPAAAPGAFIGELDGIACVSTTTCTAVGYLYAGEDDLAQAQRLVSGTWVRDDVPTVITGFTAVACPTANACTAVATEGGPDDLVTGVGDRSDTGKWSFTPLDLHDNGTGRLTGITCRAVDTCTAVADSRGRPIGLQEAQGSWTTFRNVAPPGVEGSRLNGVSCRTARVCTAVGHYTNAAASLPLIERFDGTRWTRQPAPDRAQVAFTDLADVSCPTTTTCVAVGSSGTDPGGVAVPEPLLMRWSSSSGWATVPSPSPSGTEGAMTGVSCASATSCVAVGFAYGSGTGAITYVLRGSTWTAQPVTLPAGVEGVSLTGVSCVPSPVCHAVGTGYSRAGSRHLDLVWNGRAWSAGPAVGDVDAVSCVDGDTCTAVGTADDGNQHVVVNTLRSGTWTPITISGVGKGSYLSGVSCAGPICTAVGTGDDALVVRAGADQTWKLEPAVTPPGTGGLQDVSCPDTTHCVAVGTFGTTGVIETRVP